MKKLFAVLLVVAMLASMATVVSAADTTTLTTTVPAATYTLNIPADQEIEFGATNTEIGNVTVTNSAGFAVGKNLQVTANYTPFKADGLATEIPYVLKLKCSTKTEQWTSGSSKIFEGNADGTVDAKTFIMVPPSGAGTAYSPSPVTAIQLVIDSEDWGKALGGVYTSTITFTCEVVVEQ